MFNLYCGLLLFVLACGYLNDEQAIRVQHGALAFRIHRLALI